jgi:hypothetical protein
LIYTGYGWILKKFFNTNKDLLFFETSVMDQRILDIHIADQPERHLMDLITHINTSTNGSLFSEETKSILNFGEMVSDFTVYYEKKWWTCSSDMYEYSHTYAKNEQKIHEKQLDSLMDGLIFELKHIPPSALDRQDWQQRMRPAIMQFAMDVFDLKPHQMEFIETSGIVDAIQDFTRMARQFDPQITVDDIYQAGRNVATANLIQLLLGLPVKVTPSIFAYSMLYPYTDNYLDDPKIPDKTKAAFNQRFRRRLMGEVVNPVNAYETIIINLIAMIESEWDRTNFPQVYESLLAIHSAQTHSLELVAPGVSPFERNILGISFEKGGTSVMTDGYLAAGNLTYDQARILFGFGAFTQLMDDLEDIRQDKLEKRASLFSVTAAFWKLDDLSIRFFHFGHTVMSDLNAFCAPNVSVLAELMDTCVDPILLNTVAQSAEFYSKEHLSNLETHLPFRFGVLNKQRSRLARQKLDSFRLMEALIM